MSWLLGFFGGPLGWFASAAGGLWSWAKANWKLIAIAAVAVGILLYGRSMGIESEREDWQEKWTQRDTEDALIKSEHERIVAELDGAYDELDKRFKASQAARKALQAAIDEDMKSYVENHSRPAPPGACPTDTDIGDDGLLLIERARAASVPGAGPGN